MTTNVELYLSRIQKLSSSPKTHQKVKHINSTVLNDIGNEIIHSRIVIPDHQKKLNLKPVVDDHQTEVKKIDGKYNEIKHKKKALLDELQAVQNIESAIKLNLSTLKQSSISTHLTKPPRFKSQFTPQQLAKIKEIHQNQKKFKRKLQTKLKNYEQDLQMFKKQKQQQQKEKNRKMCMEKHQEREKYIKQIEQRNKQREDMLRQQKEKIMELQQKEKLFQKMEDSFLKDKEMEQQELKRKLLEHKKQREFSFEEMKRHQEQYLERKRTKDQERQENLRNFKNVNQTKFPCLFLDKIKQQQERAVLQQEEKIQMIKNFVQRKTAYAQEVRKQLHNKIKTMSESKLSSIKQTVKTQPKWLNTPQKYQQGTKYMREINSKVSKLPKKAPQNSYNQVKPKFKNYLVELKNQDQERKREAKGNTVGNIANSVGLIAAKENITSLNLAKSVKAKLELMCKLQNLQG